jgi:WD40 repeat protein
MAHDTTHDTPRGVAVVAASAMDSNIRIWDAESGNIVRTINAFPGTSTFTP